MFISRLSSTFATLVPPHDKPLLHLPLLTSPIHPIVATMSSSSLSRATAASSRTNKAVSPSPLYSILPTLTIFAYWKIAAATAAVGIAYIAFASFSSAPAAAGAGSEDAGSRSFSSTAQNKNQSGGYEGEIPTKNRMDKKTSEARAGGSKDQGEFEFCMIKFVVGQDFNLWRRVVRN